MELRDAHYDLLDALIQDMEPFDQVIQTLSAPLAPREAIDLLLELQGLGPGELSHIGRSRDLAQPTSRRLRARYRRTGGRAERPFQSDLWFRLTEAGQAEWRAKNGQRPPSGMWRIAEYDDVLEVNAVSAEVAAGAVARWQERSPETAIEHLNTKAPAPFTLSDGTRVEPGILITFRRRRLQSRPLS